MARLTQIRDRQTEVPFKYICWTVLGGRVVTNPIPTSIVNRIDKSWNCGCLSFWVGRYTATWIQALKLDFKKQEKLYSSNSSTTIQRKNLLKNSSFFSLYMWCSTGDVSLLVYLADTFGHHAPVYADTNIQQLASTHPKINILGYYWSIILFLNCGLSAMLQKFISKLIWG